MIDFIQLRKRFFQRSTVRWLLVIVLLAALAVLLAFCFTRPPDVPAAPTSTPTLMPTITQAPSLTPTWTATPSPSHVPFVTSTFTPTSLPTGTATSSPTATETPSPSFTAPAEPTNSPTAIDTTIPGRDLTPVVGTATPTIPPLPEAGADWWTVIHLKKLRGK